MVAHYRAESIVLAKENQGEADQTITFFARDIGMVRARAVSSRKLISKLRGGLLLFSSAHVEFVQGRMRKTLVEARTRKARNGIRQDFHRLRAAFRVSETVVALSYEHDTDGRVYDLLEETFNAMEAISLSRLSLLYYVFFWKFLHLLGYGPGLGAKEASERLQACDIKDLERLQVSLKERQQLNRACRASFLNITNPSALSK
ncbi:MAG: DNA repair protein RecO [bacterium]|nr:DNA repair protein RecO [bacterium]